MLFFSILLRRTRRVLICLKRSALRAAAIAFAVSFMICMYMRLFTDKVGAEYKTISDVLIVTMICSWFVCFIAELTKYALNTFHRYDEDIIGTAFTGMDRKSAIFEKGNYYFHHGDFRNAMDCFAELETGDYLLTTEEKGVLSFYRGRCYHIIGAYPNALLNYEKAQANGFDIPVLPIFIARCSAENGDTDRALQLYSKLIDPSYKHHDVIRTEVGKMYLRLNDGETALKWFQEAINLRENYSDALGGAAIAYTMLKDFKKGEELYRAALLNGIRDPVDYTNYYKEIQAAVLLETHTS